jgi:hypothetical protein
MGKTIALRFENISFQKKPSLYALKTLNLKLTLPSLADSKAKLAVATARTLPTDIGYLSPGSTEKVLLCTERGDQMSLS